MTFVIETEPELQPQGGLTPPSTPKRTALATDEPEKRKCKHCGHVRADHLGPKCRGAIPFAGMGGNVLASPGVQVTSTSTSFPCLCTVYEPKDD